MSSFLFLMNRYYRPNQLWNSFQMISLMMVELWAVWCSRCALCIWHMRLWACERTSASACMCCSQGESEWPSRIELLSLSNIQYRSSHHIDVILRHAHNQPTAQRRPQTTTTKNHVINLDSSFVIVHFIIFQMVFAYNIFCLFINASYNGMTIKFPRIFYATKLHRFAEMNGEALSDSLKCFIFFFLTSVLIDSIECVLWCEIF